MRTPHTATLYPQNEVLAGALVKGYEDGDPVAIECQMTPMDAKDAYDMVGADVKEPWLLMANLGPQDLFDVGANVEYEGRRYTVASAVRVFEGFGVADHFSVALEAVQN